MVKVGWASRPPVCLQRYLGLSELAGRIARSKKTSAQTLVGERFYPSINLITMNHTTPQNKNQSAGEMFLIGIFLTILSLNLLLFGRSFILYEGVQEFLGYAYLLIAGIALFNALSIHKS